MTTNLGEKRDQIEYVLCPNPQSCDLVEYNSLLRSAIFEQEPNEEDNEVEHGHYKTAASSKGIRSGDEKGKSDRDELDQMHAKDADEENVVAL